MKADAGPRLLAIGDSWQYVGLTKSLATELAALRFHLLDEDDAGLCENGKTIATLAGRDLPRLQEHVANLDGSPLSPAAILVSGGGNDLVQRNTRHHQATRLFALLQPGADAPDRALQAERVERFIHGELKDHWRRLLAGLAQVTRIPVLVHGYDHPVPDGRKLAVPFGPGPWLKPVFDAAGMAPDLAMRRAVMASLIDDLNAMLREVAAEFAPQVQHVSFAGVLAAQPGFAADHQLYWANELHATQKGFQALAGVVRQRLAGMGIAA